MTVLYVTEQGAEVGRQRERLVVRKGRTELASVRLDELEQVVLCGNVQLTTQAARALLLRRIDTALVTQGGAFLGRLSGGAGHHIELRQAQFARLGEEAYRLDLARRCVAGKLANLRTLLKRHQRTVEDERLARALVAIRLAQERLPAATTVDEVRGFEGHGSAAYFSAWPALVKVEGFPWEGRRRRPPPDPLNILLSFGYTLLGNLVQGMVELVGLDPYLGALHAPERGRPSLALDLMEEFRPVVVDSVVLRAVNTRQLTPADFVAAAGVEEEEAEAEAQWEQEDAEAQGTVARRRLLLTPLAARKWIALVEQRLTEQVLYEPQECRLTYRQIVREQAYRLARELQGEQRYEPFLQRI